MARAFSFFRAGGFDQVQFETGADFVALGELDWKLWVALASPTKGLVFDTRTLELIDGDGDGRIHANELVAAVKWAASLIKNHDDFLKSPETLALSAINDASDEGRLLLASAKQVLAGLGKADATSISVTDSAEAVKAFHGLPFNGDGVVPPESAKSAEQKTLIDDIIATVGGADDKSGKKGVTIDQVKAFFAAVDEYVGWLSKGEADAALMPLKQDTIGAWEALSAVRAKVDDYFARTRLAAFDARAAAALNREEKEYLALAAKDLTITDDEIKSFPLSRIEANRALPLSEGVNPAWAAALTAFSDKAVRPLLGDTATLTETQWADVKGRLDAFGAWQTSKVGAVVEKLGVDRLKALHTDAQKALLDPLFAEEKAQEPTANSIVSVEKLVRYVRDLFKFANNFVNFREFYERKTPAVFQVGTLFLDQRQAELVLRVEDAGKHATVAPLSRGYLVYADVTRPSSGEKFSIVAAITAGDSDNLSVGRNGLFKDRDGNTWDATVTRIVDNPISVRQAFWSPYKKAIRFVEEQVAKRAAAEEADSGKLLEGGVTAAGKAAEEGKTAAPAPKKLDIGIVAALGVAVGGITAALGALLQSFFGLGIWMPLGVVGLMLLISGPSMLIAWLKLRQRNIGPLLDANGWAVNANARINVPFGASLTREARLPSGSKVDLRDPYAEQAMPWKRYVLLALVLVLGGLWYLGKLDTFLPHAAKSTQLLGKHAPGYVEPAAAAPAAEEKKAPEAPPADAAK